MAKQGKLASFCFLICEETTGMRKTISRRDWLLQIPLAAAGTVLPGIASAGEQTDRPKKGFKVEKGKSRNPEGIEIGYGSFDCKVSAKDTNGQLCIFDTIRRAQTGPPLHLHHKQDEWFYVIKGEFKIQVGEETFTLKEGDSAFAPRKVPHTFIKTSGGEAQLMVMFQPAGSMEQFFKERALADKETDLQKREQQLQSLWDRHGMKVVGKPLTL